MRGIMNQKGETIVEVLIAMAVIGSVLGSAYSIVSRNTRSYQQAHEHTEALKLAETQLEYLRKNVSNVPATADFCFLENGDLKSDLNDCKFGVDNRYSVRVTKDTTTEVYNSIVEWAGINGGTDKVSLSYKVY
jgi:prepilin-type N-terminal cleavage/methylation domain-containing protein